MEQDVVK